MRCTLLSPIDAQGVHVCLHSPLVFRRPIAGVSRPVNFLRRQCRARWLRLQLQRFSQRRLILYITHWYRYLADHLLLIVGKAAHRRELELSQKSPSVAEMRLDIVGMKSDRNC